jgi:hypothetical protein
MNCTVCGQFGHDDPHCQIKNGPRKGAHMGGIRTVSDVKDRCIIDSETGCWLWAGATASAKGRIIPVAWFASEGRVVTVPRMAYAMKNKAKPGPMVWRICRNDRCCNPTHMQSGTRKEWGAWLAGEGFLKNDPQRSAINTRIRRSRKDNALSEELAAWARESEQSGVEAAHALGVSPTTVSRVRMGRVWREAVAVSSIFSMAANFANYREAA